MDEVNNKPDKKWGESHAMHDPYVLANFKPRTTDVLITTPPKAGTTWMQQILHQLRSGGDTTFTSIDNVVPWLEITRAEKSWQEVLSDFESSPDPRLFKTHCTADQTPGIGIAKIILTSRDPRDCCVSFYHHIMNMTNEARSEVGMPTPESFEQHVNQWLEFAAWYRNVQSWWPYIEHPKVLWLRYQDLKTDLPANVDRIAHFLEWELTPEHKEKVIEYGSFEWMKAHDEKFSSQGSGNKPVFKPGKFIRKGKVGGYRDLMSPELEKRIMDKAREMLTPECMSFLEL